MAALVPVAAKPTSAAARAWSWLTRSALGPIATSGTQPLLRSLLPPVSQLISPASAPARFFATAPAAGWALSQRQQPSQPSNPQSRRLLHQQSRLAWIQSICSAQQQRNFGTSNSTVNGVSRSLLASKEMAANRNPGNANAQNAFYQLLLKANRPDVVIERFESNQFAANSAARDSYNRALQQMAARPQHIEPQPMAAHPASMQAAAQAAAARYQGHDMSRAQLDYSQFQAPPSQYQYQHQPHQPESPSSPVLGTSSQPINVTTHESNWMVILRWTKWLSWFALCTYFSMAMVSLLVEYMMGGQKRLDPRNPDGYKSVKAENQKTRFSDVHGCEEAKEELQELVDFLRDPAKFSTLGGKLPKGVLLVGPPGTGKTLLARAIAGEAGVPFFYMSASEFDEVYVGVGARRVRDLFSAAKSKAPAIIFIDELDAMGGKRSTRDVAYNKQTLNQLLTELDGFDQNTSVIVIAATNFPQLLDHALTRPGRFDRHVTVPLPDARGRIAILNHHSSSIKMAQDVDLKAIAAVTAGLSGADLANLVNQAAVRASKLKADAVHREHLEWAKDKVIMGAEKKSMIISDKEKLMTAYHEAGHALMQLHHESTSDKRKLYKVTILPRGTSLGHTSSLPEMDTYSETATDMHAAIGVFLGGMMAEELVYGDRYTTTGVSSDLDVATEHAFHMVARYGMSKIIGPMRLDERYGNLSSETKAMVEHEVQRLLSSSYEEVRAILTARRKELDLLANALVQYETLNRKEIDKVLKGEKLDRPVIASGDKIVVPVPAVLIEGGRGGGATDTGSGSGSLAPSPPTPGGIITTPK